MIVMDLEDGALVSNIGFLNVSIKTRYDPRTKNNCNRKQGYKAR